MAGLFLHSLQTLKHRSRCFSRVLLPYMNSFIILEPLMHSLLVVHVGVHCPEFGREKSLQTQVLLVEIILTMLE